MLQPVKLFLKKHTSSKVYQLLKDVHDHVSKIHLGPPAVQMYLNTEEIETHLGINDFYGFLVPDVLSNLKMDLTFYGSDGKQVFQLNKTVTLASTFEVNVRKIFAENGIRSTFGMVTLQLSPIKNRRYEYKRMGMTGAHFYAFYHHIAGSAAGSLGHVHPSSVYSKNNKASGEFISNQIISTADLTGVRLLQCNPSNFQHDLEHQLIEEESGKVILSSKAKLAPRGVIIVDFDFSELKTPARHLYLRIDRLPSSNSKPVLVRKTKSGNFSYSHS